MGVASGITVNAEAEWASLLPLADGGHQIVRGLTVPQVTQDMDEINLQKLFESIKKKCVKNKEVKNLKVPKIIGGRINMILGIKYQNIYPQPVATCIPWSNCIHWRTCQCIEQHSWCSRRTICHQVHVILAY